MTFVDALLSCARGWIGHTETSRNSSPDIDRWLEYVHQPPGKAWCAAFVSSMHLEAAIGCGVPNPCPRTAGALRLWELAPVRCRTNLPAPGDVFVLDTGEEGGAGHVGIVESVSPDGQTITTIEGNTGDAGEREGTKVARHTWKPILGKRGKLIGYLAFANVVEMPTFVAGLPKSPFPDETT